jgi:hypothetical protein
MRLPKVDRESLAAHVPLDVVKALNYRPELFGGYFSELIHALLRGESTWSVGERELFAAYTAHLNKCPF